MPDAIFGNILTLKNVLTEIQIQLGFLYFYLLDPPLKAP